MSVRGKLDELITGVSGDIYKADRSISLIDRIGDQADQLNRNGFGDLLGNLQGYLKEHMILAITKVFERPIPGTRP